MSKKEEIEFEIYSGRIRGINKDRKNHWKKFRGDRQSWLLSAFEFIIDGKRYEAEYCIYKEDFIERQLAEAIVKQSECIEEKNRLKD